MKNPKVYPKTIVMLSPDLNKNKLYQIDEMIRHKDDSITLLDYFAGKVLSSFQVLEHQSPGDHGYTANQCYAIAEAMLKEREKRL